MKSYALAVFTVWAAQLSGRRAELAAWAGGLGAMILATLGPAGVDPVGVMSVLTGGAMLALVERTGLRLLLPAIVSVYGGAFLLASGGVPPPIPGAGWTLALCGALTCAAAAHRDLRCLLVSGAALGASAAGASTSNLPLCLMIGSLWVAATSWLLSRSGGAGCRAPPWRFRWPPESPRSGASRLRSPCGSWGRRFSP